LPFIYIKIYLKKDILICTYTPMIVVATASK